MEQNKSFMARLKEELENLIEASERAGEQILYLKTILDILKRSFRTDRRYPPYREKINPRGYTRRIYWHRIRSNPQRRRKRP